MFQKKTKKSAFASASRFNMLSFGKTYVVESNKGTPKIRILLKNVAIKDEQGNEYTREEAAQLLVDALLSGAAINCHTFDSEEGYEGNARIDITNVLGEGTPAPKQQEKAVSAPKRTYVPAVVTDEDENELEPPY
jgi:hypothetical protein